MTKMLAKSTYSIADFQSQCDEAWLLVDVYILFSFLYRWVGVAFSCALTSSSQELNSSCLIACRPGLDLWGAEWWREGDLLSISVPHLQKVIKAHTSRADFACVLGSKWSSPYSTAKRLNITHVPFSFIYSIPTVLTMHSTF